MTNENLKTLLAWLDGKKTFLLAAALAIYAIGGDAGWWKTNLNTIALLNGGALASLRSALNKTGEPESEAK